MSDNNNPPATPDRLMERRRRAESDVSGSNMPTSQSFPGLLELDNISFPPKQDELDNFKAVDPSMLPKSFKRKPEDRVFVNRSLRLDKIRWFGFDMDYTLAEYIHPQYDEMIYEMAVDQLLGMGYPKSIAELKYEHEFSIRCLFIDIKFGNILKIGKFGEILQCMHGRKEYSKEETLEVYPTLQIRSTDIGKRFFPQQTLFSTPECCLYADLVNHFETRKEYAVEGNTKPSVMSCNLEMTYKHLFHDVRSAVDGIHHSGVLKKKTLENIDKYIHRDQANLSLLLRKLREGAGGEGCKLFLLTNSEYYYTKAVMEFLLDGAHEDYPCWRDYFDVMITSARKPSFFGEGTTFREVDLETGKLKLGRQLTSFDSDAVYQGGSLELFQQLTKANPTEVLYIGDHIFADIVMSKKTVFWRTLLIVPEVAEEVKKVQLSTPIINRMLNLNFMKNEIFRGLDVNSTEDPDITALRNHLRAAAKSLDNLYSKYWGSPFRSGPKQTHFSLQVERFADLYSGSVLNLRHYPRAYSFQSDIEFLPHEFNH